MANVIGTALFSSNFTLRKSTGLPSSVSISSIEADTITYANATTDDGCDLIYHKRLALTTTPTDLDLAALTDNLGDAINFVEVVHIRIQNTSATNAMTVNTDAPTNPWISLLDGIVTLLPATSASTGASVFAAATGDNPGWAVSGTNKVLRLTASAGTLDCDVMIVGRSA